MMLFNVHENWKANPLLQHHVSIEMAVVVTFTIHTCDNQESWKGVKLFKLDLGTKAEFILSIKYCEYNLWTETKWQEI